MRGAGGMGFINRGSSLGTGIDYGTFSGKGAGGARFYGEGVVTLRGGSIPVPFLVRQSPQNRWDLITGGLVNNFPISLASGSWVQGWIFIKVKSSNGRISEISLASSQTGNFSQDPTEGGPPPELQIPIYQTLGFGDSRRLVRVIGLNNITIYPVPATWEYTEPPGCALVPSVSYIWAVFS